MQTLTVDKVWVLTENVENPCNITRILDENDAQHIVREISDGIGHCTCDAFISGKTCVHLRELGLLADEIEPMGSVSGDSGNIYHQFLDSNGISLCTCRGSAYRYADCACKHSYA